MNETELLKAFRKERSEEAFAELVRRYAGLVYSVAKRRLANATQAEDITQLVFIRFAKAPPNVQTHGELVAWLHRTTLNVAIDSWRSETRRRNREQQALVMEDTTNSAWEDISPNLDQAVNQLSDEDRQAILLRFFGEKTMRDVGIALGVSEAAAKMRIGRAVERLRKQLSVGGVACTAVVLGSLLAERSVDAAPLQLVSRLAAMRLPELAGAAAKGGLLHALSRISKFKLAAGAAVLVVLVFSAMHLARSTKISAPEAVSQASAASNASNANPVQNVRAPKRVISSDIDAALAPPVKPAKILFHVLDAETGLGLPQTKIEYVYFGPGGQKEGHNTVTDDNGDAALLTADEPANDSALNVFVTAEGHVPKAVGFAKDLPDAVSFAKDSAITEYTMKLDPAGTAGGIVVDQQGLPVSGVAIFIGGPGRKSGQVENISFQTCPVTNREDGSWTCSYIPKDFTNQFSFILKKPGYAGTLILVPEQPLNLNNLVLVINSGSVVTGKVTDQQGHPIVDARISVRSDDSYNRQSTHADQNGAFTLTGIFGEPEISSAHDFPLSQRNDSGAVILRGMAGTGPLHVDLAIQARGFAAEKQTVQLPETTNVANFVLSPGNVFRGRVVDELGNPIPNAVVQTDYTFDGKVGRPFDWITHTDANGFFEWDDPPAREITYWFEAKGYKPIRDWPLLADGSDHEIMLQRLPEK